MQGTLPIDRKSEGSAEVWHEQLNRIRATIKTNDVMKNEFSVGLA